MAYQLLRGNLIPRFDSFLNVWLWSELYFQCSIAFFKLYFSFAYKFLFGLLWYQVFLSNTNNLHTVVWFKVYLPNINNVWLKAIILNIGHGNILVGLV